MKNCRHTELLQFRENKNVRGTCTIIYEVENKTTERAKRLATCPAAHRLYRVSLFVYMDVSANRCSYDVVIQDNIPLDVYKLSVVFRTALSDFRIRTDDRICR